jgi:hypothetical protein
MTPMAVRENVEFVTRIVPARCMLERVFVYHLPCARVTTDGVSGDDDHVRRLLTEHHIPCVLAVHPQNPIRQGLDEGCASVRMDEWFARKHRGRW